MSEKKASEVLDGAKVVKTNGDEANEIAQAWYGGTTVNVFLIRDGAWIETTCWNISDEKGEPVSREVIEKHMEMRFEMARQEGEW